jgi:hypothetical protein
MTAAALLPRADEVDEVDEPAAPQAMPEPAPSESAPPLSAVPHPPASDLSDEGVFRAIVLGIAVGVPVFALVSFVAFALASPATSAGSLAWLAVWTGLWAGVFLGGTIGVGLHLFHQEHGKTPDPER